MARIEHGSHHQAPDLEAREQNKTWCQLTGYLAPGVSDALTWEEAEAMVG